MDLRKLIEEYLGSAKVMQLASAADNQPWLCTLNYVYDDVWNIYWISQRSRRHSAELKANPKVACSILKDVDSKQCMHIEGDAAVADDLEKANGLYAARYGDKPERLQEAKSNDESKRTYYVLKPRLVVVYDEKNFPDNPRQEYKVG